MNKQLKLNKDGSIKGRGIEWTDYTWNPIAGCFHACQWTMPDGTIANCYAEDVADRVAGAVYPNGFEYNYWNPKILEEPLKLKKPARIFVGSMADVFGHWVEADHITQVLDVCRLAYWHTFQFLTKNPKRVLDFIDQIPPNCWIGASTPPNFMWNKELTENQRGHWFDTTIRALGDIHASGIATWMSAEPITIDVAGYIGDFLGDVPIDWMVIGAASNGNKLYSPNETLVKDAVEFNDQHNIATFFKGNLRSLPWAAANWREEFPKVKETIRE